MRHPFLLSSLFAVLWGTAAVNEAGGLPEGVQLHGFLSQGYVKSSANDFFGDSSAGSWDLRELGLNLSYQPYPKCLISGQILSRTAGEMYDGSPQLDYGLLDYAPVMEAQTRLGVRLGRLKNPLGFYNDTRDVPFTRPSIFLPQSIYFDRVRNLELSLDGAGVYGDWQVGSRGDLSAQFYAGPLVIDDNVEYTFLGGDQPGELGIDEPWLVWRLLYEEDGGRVRVSVSRANGKLQYQPGAVDFLGAGRIDLDFWVLSAQYNAEVWSLTAEYLYEPLEWRGFGVPGLDKRATLESFYLQGTYRLLPDWEMVLRFERNCLDRSDCDGTRQQAETGLPAHNYFMKDITLGLRWDVSSQWMLRAEYHWIQGTSLLSPRENSPLEKRENWNLFSLQASFRF